jgi:transcription elongation factor Elf1
MKQIFEDTDFRDAITCPVCGYHEIDSWEMQENEDEDWTCKNCGATLHVSREVSVSYSAKVISLENIDTIYDKYDKEGKKIKGTGN